MSVLITCDECKGEGGSYVYDPDIDDSVVPDSDRLMYLIQDVGEQEAYEIMREDMHNVWVPCDKCRGWGKVGTP